MCRQKRHFTFNVLAKRPVMVLAVLIGAVLFAKAIMISPAYAQDVRAEFPAEISKTEAAIKKFSNAQNIEALKSDEALAARINEIMDLRAGSLSRISVLTEERMAAAAALEQATPEEGGAADPVASRKLKAVQAQLEKIDGLVVRANLNVSSAEQLILTLSDQRKAAYFSTMFQRTSPPFAPKVRKNLWELGGQVFSKTIKWVGELKATLTPGQFALRIGTALLPLILLIGLASPLYFRLELLWLPRKFKVTQSNNAKPKDKFVMALLRACIRALVFAIPALVVFGLLYLTGVIVQKDVGFVLQIYFVLCGVMFADGVALGLLSPARPGLRVAILSDRRARNYRWFGIAALWVFALDRIALLAYEHAGMRVSLEAVQAQSAMITLLASILVLFAGAQAPLGGKPLGKAQTRQDEKDAQSQQSAGLRKFRFAEPFILLLAMRYVAVILAFAGIATSAVGYVELGRILIWVLILTILVVAVYLLLRHTLSRGIRFVWGWLWTETGEAEDIPAGTTGGTGGFILTIWLRLLADLVLLFVAGWVFLRLANFQISDLDILASRLSEGLPVGLSVIKFKDLVGAFFAFVAVLTLFRGIQAYIRHNMNTSSTITEGAGASVLTLVGYLGFVFALFVGFSALGIAWSNIAIIAGALSVGIGFGLQSVVNNFVSGLILLFERPINNGDWVSTSAGEGKVRHIGLRSTEIRSFDRASILIPNSDLITAPLTNWTHKDKVGRVRVDIGVSYDSDPEKVRELLLKCAQEQASVRRSPAPFVYWKGFGESSLDFELRAFTSNIINIIAVETDLRFAIFKTLQEAGVSIPFPQRVVHYAQQEVPKPVRRKQKPKPASDTKG